MTVEKPLTAEMLGDGWIRVSAREAESLGLPSFSGGVKVETTDEVFECSWNASSRLLTGEFLEDYLQLSGREGWFVRLDPVETGIRLDLVEVRSSSVSARRRSAPTPARPAKQKVPQKRRRQGASRYRLRDRSEFEWIGDVGIHTSSLDELLEAIQSGGWDDHRLAELRIDGERLAALDHFEELMAVDVARVDQMPHQEAAARKLLAKMGGRGVLADEVGLGKTIEAGLILKELRLRGLIDRTLVICPAQLRHQWRDELFEKFGEEFSVIAGRAELGAAGLADNWIMTSVLARNNVEALMAEQFDLIVVDEAHKVRGAKTAAAVSELSQIARYALFLTATPVENSLDELYQLVELVRPGTFRSKRDFNARYTDKGDKRRPKDPAALRTLVSDVIVRTTRAQAGLNRVRREVVDIPIELHRVERELYDHCVRSLRLVLNGEHDHLRRRQLAIRLTTSPTALAESALKIARKHDNPEARRVLTELAHLAGEIDGSTRERVALKKTQEWLAEHGRVIVFTQHTATVTGLAEFFTAAGLPVATFHGEMSHDARRKAVAEFRDGLATVLISSDAGAEGQNLQFCQCVINYDLPWNPMRIEQRIGRVDRLTQQSDVVYVANLYAKHTIDERVVQLLRDKLAMFELLFGQITTILGEIDDGDGATFEQRVLNALTMLDDAEMDERLERFGSQLRHAREEADSAISSAGVSEWVAASDRFDHRDQLPTSGATELMPEARLAGSDRQGRVVAWVTDVLAATGATTRHDVPGEFISASLGEALAEQLGVDEVNLAFGRSGLETHPEAELCSAGSEVFDALLDALRSEGDLVGYLAPLAPLDDLEIDDLPLADGVRRSERTVAQTGCRGEAIVRVKFDDGTQRIEVVAFGGGLPEAAVLEQCGRLCDGAADGWLGEPSHLRAGVRDVVVATYAPVAAELTEATAKAAVEETRQLIRNLEAHRDELSGRRAANEQAQADLDRQIESLRSKRSTPKAQLRVEVLQLRVYAGEDRRVVDTYELDGGRSIVLDRPVRENAVPAPSAADGSAIQRLGFCRNDHPADDSLMERCERCDTSLCSTCDEALDTCRACLHRVCPSCRGADEAGCRRCVTLQRRSRSDVLDELAPFVPSGADAYELGAKDATYFLIVAGDRRSIVRWSAGAASLIATTSKSELPLAALAVERRIGHAVSVVVDRSEPAYDAGIELYADGRFEVSATITLDGESLGELETELADRSGVDQFLATELDDPQPPAPPSDPAIVERFEPIIERLPANEAPPASLSVTVLDRSDRLALVAAGLSRFSNGRRSLHPFISVDEAAPPDMLPAGMSSFVQSVAGDTTATAARYGPGIWVAIDQAGQQTVRQLSGGQEAGDQYRIMAALDESRTVDVRRVVPRADLGFVTLDGATLINRSLAPAIVDAGDDLGQSMTPGVVASALEAAAPLPAATDGAPWCAEQGAVSAALEVRLPAPVASVTGDIEWRVEERWEVHGVDVDLRYVIPPQTTQGVIEIGGVGYDTIVRCSSEGHLAVSARHCFACETSTCDACERSLAECGACGRYFCGDHGSAGADGGCAVCDRLEKVRRSAPVTEGLDVGLMARIRAAEFDGHRTAVVSRLGSRTVYRSNLTRHWERAR